MKLTMDDYNSVFDKTIRILRLLDKEYLKKMLDGNPYLFLEFSKDKIDSYTLDKKDSNKVVPGVTKLLGYDFNVIVCTRGTDDVLYVTQSKYIKQVIDNKLTN